MARIILLAIAFSSGFSPALWASGEVQQTYSAAVNSGRLDSEGVSARDQALGAAVVASSQGSSAFMNNPALLAGSGLAVAFDEENNLFYQRSLLSGSIGAGSWGTGGAGISYASFGQAQGVDINGTQYSVNPYQSGLSLGFGRPLGANWKAGLGVDGLAENFGGYGTKYSFGSDVGVAWSRGGLSLALAQGLESDSDERASVSSLKAGLSYRIEWLGSQVTELSAQFDTDYGYDKVARYGIEHVCYGLLALRGGWVAPMDQDGSPAQWSAGLGLPYRAWEIDFTYSSRADLGQVQRASVSWRP